jgi:hypothetical protein
VGVRNQTDSLYGLIPEIPKEFRRAPDSSKLAEADARARTLQRRRYLQLLGV